MNWQLRSLLLVCLVWSCTPDAFDYGGGAAGGSTCREDGCTDPCPPGTKEGPSGSCEPACGAWQASLSIPSPGALIATTTKVYAVGTSGDDDGRPAQGVVQPVDPCGGTLADAILPLSDKGSSLGAAAANGGVLVLAGVNEGQVALAELELGTGTTKATHALGSLPPDSVVNDVSASAAGAWAVGSSKTSGAWFAQLSSGAACSAPASGATNATAVAALSDGALLVLELGGKLRVARVGAGGCGAPSFTSPELVLPGADSASARDLLVIDASAYLVGHARAGAGEPFGFVARLDVSSGVVEKLARWDPGPGAEALHAVVAVGSRLYAGGVSGAALPDDDTSGNAGVVAWALPLESDAAPIWTEQLKARRVRALAENGGSVFALASTGTNVSSLASFALAE